MAQVSTEAHYHSHERRPSKSKFRWVRRLMQQGRSQTDEPLDPNIGSSMSRNFGVVQASHDDNERGSAPMTTIPLSVRFHGAEQLTKDNVNVKDNTSMVSSLDRSSAGAVDNNSAQSEKESFAIGSDISSTAGRLSALDNASTIPLKSLSPISTKTPSILSSTHENSSTVPSTADTSIAPSIYNTFQLPNVVAGLQQQANYDRDSESIITLASSTRRAHRRSLDTNSSVAGIAPASIFDRLSTQPNTNSIYAGSIQNSNFTERTSMYYAHNAASQSSLDVNDQYSSG